MHDPSSPRWRDFPRALWLALLVTLVLGLPTLGMGFALDDHIHLLILEGRWALGSPLDLFRFAGGDAEGMRRIVQEGPYPWWTLPELRLAFWRPLSSALAVLDHRLFGREALGYHLHLLAWYLGLVPLEDPSLVFLRSREGGLRRFTPPPLGTRLLLSATGPD